MKKQEQSNLPRVIQMHLIRRSLKKAAIAVIHYVIDENYIGSLDSWDGKVYHDPVKKEYDYFENRYLALVSQIDLQLQSIPLPQDQQRYLQQAMEREAIGALCIFHILDNLDRNAGIINSSKDQAIDVYLPYFHTACRMFEKYMKNTHFASEYESFLESLFKKHEDFQKRHYPAITKLLPEISELRIVTTQELIDFLDRNCQKEPPITI